LQLPRGSCRGAATAKKLQQWQQQQHLQQWLWLQQTVCHVVDSIDNYMALCYGLPRQYLPHLAYTEKKL